MKPETRSFYELAVRRTVQCILQSLDEALDLESLARSAALSPFHFHRVFRGMVGETPLELHRRLRLERAAYRLREADAPVTTVAIEAGYDTHEAFTRAFRARFCCSPSEFRRSREGGAEGCARPFQIEITARSGIHFRPGLTQPPEIHFIQGGKTMNVEIQNLEELRVAAVRHHGPYHRISEAFARLGAAVGPAGLIGPGCKMIGIYHDDPESTPEAELRSDAALSIPEDAKLPDGLTEMRIPGGRYARTIHVGPYEKLGDTWARFMGEWLPGSGHRVGDGAAIEIYRNTPGQVPPEKLETELYIRIE